MLWTLICQAKKSITGYEVGYFGLYENHGKFLSRYLGEQLSEVNIWFTGKKHYLSVILLNYLNPFKFQSFCGLLWVYRQRTFQQLGILVITGNCFIKKNSCAHPVTGAVHINGVLWLLCLYRFHRRENNDTASYSLHCRKQTRVKMPNI